MKALFCGLGSVGQRHLRNLRTLMGDDVTVLAYRARGSSPVLNANMTVREGAALESTYNLRAFTEQWTRPAAGMMLGLGHTVMGGRTLSYEFMRIEIRADGTIAYVAKPTDKPEEAFVYQGTRDDRGATRHVFSNPARDFPTEIDYTRTPGGELFASVRGKVNGTDHQVIYPFHRVDCATGKPL